MSNGRVYVMMVLAALFWSGAFIAGKLSIQEFPPSSLTFFRFLFALPFIFVILYLRQPDNWLPGRRDWLPIILLGLLGTFLYHILFFTCLKYTTAINSSLIGATNPMITVLLAVLLFKEDLTLRRVTGIITSFFGVFLIITNGDRQILLDFRFNFGDMLMFAAAWCWALYSVFSRRVMQEYRISPLMLTAYTFLICTIVSIPFLIWEQPSSYLPRTTAGGWLSVLYMTIFASVLGYLFQLIAIQTIGAPRTMIFVNLVPVFTAVQSVLVLGETLTWFKVLSACFIIMGVYLTTRSERQPIRQT